MSPATPHQCGVALQPEQVVRLSMKEPILWIIFGSIASTIVLNQLGLDAEYRGEMLLEYGHIAIPTAAFMILGLAIYLLRANRQKKK